MKVVVFGPPGGGKSTLSARIAHAAGLPLHPLDCIQYAAAGGARLPDDDFNARLAALFASPTGSGPRRSAPGSKRCRRRSAWSSSVGSGMRGRWWRR